VHSLSATQDRQTLRLKRGVVVQVRVAGLQELPPQSAFSVATVQPTHRPASQRLRPGTWEHWVLLVVQATHWPTPLQADALGSSQSTVAVAARHAVHMVRFKQRRPAPQSALSLAMSQRTQPPLLVSHEAAPARFRQSERVAQGPQVFVVGLQTGFPTGHSALARQATHVWAALQKGVLPPQCVLSVQATQVLLALHWPSAPAQWLEVRHWTHIPLEGLHTLPPAHVPQGPRSTPTSGGPMSACPMSGVMPWSARPWSAIRTH